MINKYCAELYCNEDIKLIENYTEAISDKSQTWVCHHKAEILPCGKFKARHLIKSNLYFNRPANELIFLTRAEHNKIHTIGRKLTAEIKNKIRKSNTGKPGANLGRKFSLSWCEHIRLALKGKVGNRKGAHHTKSARKKISDAHKGKTPWNKGKHGKHWFNNGVINIQRNECPEGFTPGRLLKH